jgi:prepilin-type N-terminal cleavage/methylation domain-containing protein
MSTPRNRFPRSSRKRGFTLIEASLTTVIIGVGFLSMLQLLAAGTMTNIRAIESTTAVNLAKNVREMSLKKKFSEIPALDGASYQPPIDSQGKALSDFDNWKQTVAVHAVDPDRMTLDISDATPSAVRVTVVIEHNGARVCDVSWYAYDPNP